MTQIAFLMVIVDILETLGIFGLETEGNCSQVRSDYISLPLCLLLNLVCPAESDPQTAVLELPLRVKN